MIVNSAARRISVPLRTEARAELATNEAAWNFPLSPPE